MLGRSENEKLHALLYNFGGMGILHAATIDFCDLVLGRGKVGQFFIHAGSAPDDQIKLLSVEEARQSLNVR